MVDKLITGEVFGDRRSVGAGSYDDVSLVLNTYVISDDVFVKCFVIKRVLYVSLQTFLSGVVKDNFWKVSPCVVISHVRNVILWV